jgi:thiosulfate/3-mercaptopyruvate sulfurtransferase
LRNRLERLGIGDESRIVVIAGADWASPSTRILWTLQAAGLGGRSRWLDGGSDGWKRAGLPTTTMAPAAPTPGHLTLPADRRVVVDHAWIQAHLDDPRVRIIDGRAPVFYEGVGMPEHNEKAGHIPGAVNIPFNTLVDDSMEVLPLPELRRIFAAAGVTPGDTVAAYCHVGQQATVVILAARLLGYPARLYDGSYNEWKSLKLPTENLNPTATPAK